ncbi:MAG: polysaccharide deacetylase family protein [Polyangiaceae bacterium]
MSLELTLMRLATAPGPWRWLTKRLRGGAVIEGPGVRAEVALTFDDGPHRGFTPRVLDALDAIQARATFFVVGRHVEAEPQLVREMHRRGHEIGTHLYSHARETVFQAEAFEGELTRCKRQLEDLLGAPLRWLRFPYGEHGRQSVDAIEARHGVRAAHWTYSSHDSRAPNAESVSARVVAGLRPGAIVLLHDALADAETLRPPYVADRNATILALPHIGAALEAQQLRAVTLSELMQ